jgi:hypothetical protein
MADMYCFRCLTNDHEHVPAVTAFLGTLLCERCAAGEEQLRRETVEETADGFRL